MDEDDQGMLTNDYYQAFIWIFHFMNFHITRVQPVLVKIC